MKKSILVIGTFLLTLSITAQNKVSGYVFEDANKNNKKERREKGIPNVAVTNGEQVVLTDVSGKYELPIGEDNIISVIKPSDYTVGVNKDNLPQFFYIHKPKGSPKTKFKGVDPTGKLPKSVNFGLYPSQKNIEFTALIFGDPQPYTLEEVAFFRDGVVSDVENVNTVKFGLSLGDLVGNDLSLFTPYIKAVQKIGIPWYNVLGNHDLNFDVEQDELSDETYEAHFGPANFAFNYGNVHFIVLDDVLYPDKRNIRKYWGGFRKDQLEFVKNDLKYVPKDHLVVIAFHIPISEPTGDSFRDEDRKALFQLLKEYPHTLSLSAHTHIQRQDFMTAEHGWLRDEPHHHYNVGTTSGDWYSGELNEQGIPVSTMRDGTPKGYAFIDFDGNQYKIRYKVAGKDEDYQIDIFNPKVVAKGRKSKSGIYANFFMGSEYDSVVYRIDNGEWKKMKYVVEQDPSFEAELYRWDTSDRLIPGRRASNAIESKHLWRGEVNTNLSLGMHVIEVQATDMYGKVHHATSSYRLEEAK